MDIRDRGLRYLVYRHADSVDEFDLHSRQLRRLLAIHHVSRLDVQLTLLNVALFKELARNQLRHLPIKPCSHAADQPLFRVQRDLAWVAVAISTPFEFAAAGLFTSWMICLTPNQQSQNSY